MVKNAVVDRPPGDEHRVAVPLGVREHFRVQMAIVGDWLADPNIPHARDAADGPFFHHRLKPGRTGPNPKLDREIIRTEIAHGVAEVESAVGSVEVERPAHHPVAECNPVQRAIIGAHQVGPIALSFPPTYQAERRGETLREWGYRYI